MKDRINQENESLYQTSTHIKAATEYEESDEPLYILDNLRNTTTLLIGGENASKVQHVIINSEGEQLQFSIHIYVVKDEKVYELSSHGEPFKVPETSTIGENIIKSFRFI